MKEIWKDVKGYEGLYKVSNFGNVKTIKNNKILKINTTGEYGYVALYRDRKKTIKKIHRLVAENFIENPNNYPCVNHKDENKWNNKVDNLEWCTQKYNCNYKNRNKKLSKSKCRFKIKQIDLNGKTIKIWQDIWELRNNTSYNTHVIRQCCQKRCKTSYGYKWEYEVA